MALPSFFTFSRKHPSNDKMKMRIGYLTYGLDRAPTGIGRYAVELLRSLSEIPEDLEIVLLTTEQADPLGLWDRFEHHALPGCQLLPALMTAGNMLLSQAEHRYRLDILHDPNGIAPFYGPKHKTKRIVTIHDAFSYVYPETHNRLDNWRYNWILPRATRRADTVITVSECSKEDITQFMGVNTEKVVVTPEGVNPSFRPIANTVERQSILARYGIVQPYILYVGGINARKNIARLLKAFALIQDHFPEVTLIIGGKRQWQLDEIDMTFKQGKFRERVHFTGYVADADLPALYTSAEIFVFPSLYEGFGLPPLEAMACGTPVIVSEAASLLEVAGNAALTVNPYDVEGMAAAMKMLLSDQGLQAELQLRGLKRASLFSWKRTALETLKVYQKVQ